MIQTEMEYTGPVKDFQGARFDVRSPSRTEQAKLPELTGAKWVMVSNRDFYGHTWVPARIQDFTPITGKPVF